MGDPHPLALTKSVLDPVHGLIRLTVEELQVLNSGVFQRLRRIKQNGLLSYVFPAASHTRFEHSLGALFVAESMLQAIWFNGAVANAKIPCEVGNKPRDAVHLGSHFNDDELKSLFRLTRLAALSHDLGHGPLSHTFEKFAPNRSSVISILENGGGAGQKALAQAIRGDSHQRIDHEWVSCLLFLELFASIGNNDEETPLAVAAAIQNQPNLAKGTKYERFIPLVHDLIASAPADADRMDYVERDSRSCGVSYGLFDRSRVLKSLLCYLDDKGDVRLGVKSSGFRAIENFIQARFELFVQIYYHKTNRAVELMLKHIGALAERYNLTIMREDSLGNLVDDYVNIGDEEFLDMLVGRRASTVAAHQDIVDLAKLVRARRLWRRVEDFREALVPVGKEDAFLAELRSATSGDLVMDKVEAKATKDLDKGAALLFRADDGMYRYSTAPSWTKASPLIEALAKQEGQVMRIYLKGTDPETAKNCRVAALRLEAKYRGQPA